VIEGGFCPDLERGLRFKKSILRRRPSDMAIAEQEQMAAEVARVIAEVTQRDKLVGRVLKVAWDPSVTLARLGNELKLATENSPTVPPLRRSKRNTASAA
jgi:hypothetical protein